jgi:hypothetical protein
MQSAATSKRRLGVFCDQRLIELAALARAINPEGQGRQWLHEDADMLDVITRGDDALAEIDARLSKRHKPEPLQTKRR